MAPRLLVGDGRQFTVPVIQAQGTGQPPGGTRSALVGRNCPRQQQERPSSRFRLRDCLPPRAIGSLRASDLGVADAEVVQRACEVGQVGGVGGGQLPVQLDGFFGGGRASLRRPTSP
jgi:hypothetical protein